MLACPILEEGAQMQRLQTRTVRFEATQAVELKPGVILPRGYYTGTETRTGLETASGGVSWTAPHYKIALTREQLPKMGGLISEEIDVTKLCASGELAIT